MNGALDSSWPVIVGCILTAIGTYVAFIHALRMEVALLKLRMKKNEERLDRKSAMLDEFKDNMTEIREEFKDDMNDLKTDVGELRGEIKVLQHQFEAVIKALKIKEE